MTFKPGRPSASLLIAMCCLAGCADPQPFRDGQVLAFNGHGDEALAIFEKASKANPDNAEYRMALISLRGELAQRQLSAADTARRSQQWDDAESAYRRALAYDPANAMALAGLRELDGDRRHAKMIAEALKPTTDSVQLETSIALLTNAGAESPTDRAIADALSRLVDRQSTLVARGETRLAESFRKPVTIEVHDVPLHAVFDLLSKASGLNFFFDRDVKQDVKVSISAKATSVEDALKALLLTNQLEQRVLNDTSIIVYPVTPQKQKDYQTLSVRSFLLTNADAKAVANSLKTILKLRDVTTDDRLGMVLVRDTPEALELAARLVAIEDLDDPEVMLEIEVLEIKRSNLRDLGLQWPAQVSLAPLPLTTASGASVTLKQLLHPRSLPIGVTGATVVANAQQEDSDSNILANPRIRVRNKEKAKILIGDRVPVITTTSTSTGFISDSVNYVDVGLKLEVEPQVYRDGEVAIKLGLEVGNIVKQVTTQSGTLAYQIGTRNASTVLRLHDGETQVLAGLIDSEDRKDANKIPGLGSLPIIGRLFGADSDDLERDQIVLSITPHILRAFPSQDRVFTEFESGTETAVGSRSDSVPPAVDTKAIPTAVHRLAAPAPAPPIAAPLGTVISPGAAAAPPQGSPASTTPFNVSAPVPQTIGAPATEPVVTNAQVAPDATDAPTTVPTGAPLVTWQGQSAVSLGNDTRVDIRLENVNPAATSFSLVLAYDPKVLHVMGIAPGDLIAAHGDSAAGNLSTRVDDAQGRIYLNVLADASHGISGTGVLASLTLRAGAPTDGSRLQFVSLSGAPGLGAGPDFLVKVIGS